MLYISHTIVVFLAEPTLSNSSYFIHAIIKPSIEWLLTVSCLYQPADPQYEGKNTKIYCICVCYFEDVKSSSSCVADFKRIYTYTRKAFMQIGDSGHTGLQRYKEECVRLENKQKLNQRNMYATQSFRLYCHLHCSPSYHQSDQFQTQL